MPSPPMVPDAAMPTESADAVPFYATPGMPIPRPQRWRVRPTATMLLAVLAQLVFAGFSWKTYVDTQAEQERLDAEMFRVHGYHLGGFGVAIAFLFAAFVSIYGIGIAIPLLQMRRWGIVVAVCVALFVLFMSVVSLAPNIVSVWPPTFRYRPDYGDFAAAGCAIVIIALTLHNWRRAH